MVCSPIFFQHMNMGLHDSTNNNVIKDIFDLVSLNTTIKNYFYMFRNVLKS